MQYIIIPTELFEQADMTLAEKLGLNNPRRSVDGTEVVMHLESYNKLFGENDTTTYREFPIYDSNSEEFVELLNSDVWSSSEEI